MFDYLCFRWEAQAAPTSRLVGSAWSRRLSGEPATRQGGLRMSGLKQGHYEVEYRYHAAGEDRGDGMAVDWHEREILGPLVDVADSLRRVADGNSPHYRAEKAGALLYAAIRTNEVTMIANAGWPEPETGTHDAIQEATVLLTDLTTQIRQIMWGLAAPSPDDRPVDMSATAARLVDWANRHSPDVRVDNPA